MVVRHCHEHLKYTSKIATTAIISYIHTHPPSRNHIPHIHYGKYQNHIPSPPCAIQPPAFPFHHIATMPLYPQSTLLSEPQSPSPSPSDPHLLSRSFNRIPSDTVIATHCPSHPQPVALPTSTGTSADRAQTNATRGSDRASMQSDSAGVSE